MKKITMIMTLMMCLVMSFSFSQVEVSNKTVIGNVIRGNLLIAELSEVSSIDSVKQYKLTYLDAGLGKLMSISFNLTDSELFYFYTILKKSFKEKNGVSKEIKINGNKLKLTTQKILFMANVLISIEAGGGEFGLTSNEINKLFNRF